MNHCQPSRRVTHCRCWLLERELWCFWGWTSRPAGDWRSRLQHRRRRWISPWNIWSKHMRENIVLIIRSEQKVEEDEDRNIHTVLLTRTECWDCLPEWNQQSFQSQNTDPVWTRRLLCFPVPTGRWRPSEKLQGMKSFCFWPGKEGKLNSPRANLNWLYIQNAQVLTRYDVHEERGQFVNEQHGRMVGYSEQQEVNNGWSERHAQSRSCTKKISKPARKTQKTQSEHLFVYV